MKFRYLLLLSAVIFVIAGCSQPTKSNRQNLINSAQKNTNDLEIPTLNKNEERPVEKYTLTEAVFKKNEHSNTVIIESRIILNTDILPKAITYSDREALMINSVHKSNVVSGLRLSLTYNDAPFSSYLDVVNGSTMIAPVKIKEWSDDNFRYQQSFVVTAIDSVRGSDTWNFVEVSEVLYTEEIIPPTLNPPIRIPTN